jgi:hypothetical protein
MAEADRDTKVTLAQSERDTAVAAIRVALAAEAVAKAAETTALADRDTKVAAAVADRDTKVAAAKAAETAAQAAETTAKAAEITAVAAAATAKAAEIAAVAAMNVAQTAEATAKAAETAAKTAETAAVTAMNGALAAEAAATAALNAEQTRAAQLAAQLVAARLNGSASEAPKMPPAMKMMDRLDRNFDNKQFALLTPGDVASLPNNYSKPVILVVDSLESLQKIKFPTNAPAYAVIIDRTQAVKSSSPPVLKCVAAELGGSITAFNGYDVSDFNGSATIYEVIRHIDTDVVVPRMTNTINPDDYEGIRL